MSNMKLYLNSMKRIIPYLSVILLIFGCEQTLPEFDDFDYTAVYFPLQYPMRTLSLGEEENYDNTLEKELIFHIAPNIGGMYENNKSWTVDFVIDESLAQNIQHIGGDTILPLPSSYYSMNPDDQVVIPSGSFRGMIEVQLTQDFLDDPLAYGNHYVIPLRITATSADSILKGESSGVTENPDRRLASDWVIPPKDFVLFGIKYVNKYHGTYLHLGMDIVYDQYDNPIDTTIYRKFYIVDSELWDLSTRGKNLIHTNGIGENHGAVDGDYKMALAFSENGDIVVDSIAGSVYAVSGSGSFVAEGAEWGGKKRDAIYLSYTFQENDTLKHVVNDTLVFRNRGIKFEEYSPIVFEPN